MVSAETWCAVWVKLFPKIGFPDRFKLVRPITILPTSCKTCSRVMLHICEEHDVGIQGTGEGDRCMLGLRDSDQCAELELVDVLRSSRENDGLGHPVFRCPSGFRAYDSVRHSAAIQALMRKRGPEPVVSAYVRDMRDTELVFEHAGWKTQGIQPTVGLRQGCSLSPLACRWVMEDLMAEARDIWTAAGNGMWLDAALLQVLAWADDTWLFATCTSQLGRMIGVLREIAKRVGGLELRLEKYTWAEVSRQGTATDNAAEERTHHLRHMGQGETRVLPPSTRSTHPARRGAQRGIQAGCSSRMEVIPQQVTSLARQRISTLR